jgi:hypothetical protein
VLDGATCISVTLGLPGSVSASIIVFVAVGYLSGLSISPARELYYYCCCIGLMRFFKHLPLRHSVGFSPTSSIRIFNVVNVPKL